MDNSNNFGKHQTGTVSELLAQAFLIEKGYTVSKPINDFNEYDLIIDDGTDLNKVQVKTAYWDNSKNRVLVSLVTSHIRGNERRTNKKYKSNSFDLLVCVHHQTHSIYMIPMNKLKGRRSITLYPEGKPETVTNRYEDFEEYKVK